MDNQPVKIGLIGCGSITHFIHIPGFQIIPGVVLASACDSSIEAVKSTANRFGISRVSDDYREVVQDPNIDAVVIATPNDFHKEVSIAALAAGKHVLCEKPLGLDSGECLEMAATSKKAGKVNLVSFVYRFVPAMRYMKHLVDSGLVGEIRHYRAFYLQRVPEVWLGWRSNKKQSGSGALGDIGTHLIDFALHLVGDITSVSGWAKTFLPKRQVGGTGKLMVADVDDAVGFLVEFATGATGVIEASRMVPGRGVGQNEYQSVEINGS